TSEGLSIQYIPSLPGQCDRQKVVQLLTKKSGSYHYKMPDIKKRSLWGSYVSNAIHHGQDLVYVEDTFGVKGEMQAQLTKMERSYRADSKKKQRQAKELIERAKSRSKQPSLKKNSRETSRSLQVDAMLRRVKGPPPLKRK
ncbi:MAG: hypothetical protein AAF202_00415, partial [Pseudomonadota bacterium]